MQSLSSLPLHCTDSLLGWEQVWSRLPSAFISPPVQNHSEQRLQTHIVFFSFLVFYMAGSGFTLSAQCFEKRKKSPRTSPMTKTPGAVFPKTAVQFKAVPPFAASCVSLTFHPHLLSASYIHVSDYQRTFYNDIAKNNPLASEFQKAKLKVRK